MWLNDKEIESLISSVQEELEKAEFLAKSSVEEKLASNPKLGAAAQAKLKQDGDESKTQKKLASNPPTSGKDLSKDFIPGEESEIPNEAPPMIHDDEEPSEEGQGAVSDEDLVRIYSSMSPEDLERHATIARMVSERMQPEQELAPEQEMAPEQEGAPGGPPNIDGQVLEDKKRPFGKSEIAFIARKIKAFDSSVNELKSLKKENDSLKKDQEHLNKSIGLLTKAIEAGFRPIRKSVAGVEFTNRAEEVSEAKILTKSELLEKIKVKVKETTLSKTDRDLINQYLLHGTDKEKVEKLIIGGK